MGTLYKMSNIMGALYKDQHHGRIMQGAASWGTYTRSSIMGTLYKDQHYGKIMQRSASWEPYTE